PLSSLDAKLREQMRDELRSLHERLNMTAVYVTHDQQEAMELSDRLYVMNAGDIVQGGTPAEVYDNPADLFVGRFLGALNEFAVERLEGSVARLRTGDVLEVSPDRVPSTGTVATVAIRPHRVELVPDAALATGQPNVLAARVTRSAVFGDRSRYTVQTDGG